MYKTILIHPPAVAQMSDVVEISTLSTIPEFLRDAVTLSNHKLLLDNIDGRKSVPSGSVICYEKSDKTASGYNCWSIGQIGVDLVKINDTLFTKPPVIHAMLIPAQDEAKPVWVNSCNITYNDDATATLHTQNSDLTGRVGIDFILCFGMNKKGAAKASILTRNDESYNDYILCDSTEKDIGKLSELYPA